jgi:hypothetical protein
MQSKEMAMKQKKRVWTEGSKEWRKEEEKPDKL